MRKCEQYWPASGDSREIDSMVVSCSHVEQSRGRGWALRKFFLLRLHDREQRTFTQLQFHGWPDHGALKDSRKLIAFWRTARALLPKRSRSAGVGRTGEYILMETLVLVFESGSPIDSIQVVKLMRDQRMATVQTDDQFVFACRAALAYYD
uniref:Uncharacterized protein n=1 Tax=Plectus sambesii TaxID=2011161 RepID=A0A914VU72_9BILA